MPPGKLTDNSLTLEKNPLAGQGEAKVDGSPENAASGSAKAPPPKKLDRTPTKDGKHETGWLEVELVDQDDQPVAEAVYQIFLADGSIREGCLGEDGKIRLDGIPPGPCQVIFPQYDSQAVKKA